MDWDLAISNNNKNRKKNIKKTNPLLPKQKVLISNKFVLKNKKIKYKKLVKKCNYTIPAIICDTASSEYFIQILFDLDSLGLKKCIKYICYYRLIKDCIEEVFKTIKTKYNK